MRHYNVLKLLFSSSKTQSEGDSYNMPTTQQTGEENLATTHTYFINTTVFCIIKKNKKQKEKPHKI